MHRLCIISVTTDVLNIKLNESLSTLLVFIGLYCKFYDNNKKVKKKKKFYDNSNAFFLNR